MAEAPKRECGGCTACCFTHSVAEAGKAVTHLFDWCSHCTKGVGCSIYEQRPNSCRKYRCLWLRGGFGDDQKRPDQFGIVVDNWPISGQPLQLIIFWECEENRFYERDVQSIIRAIIVTGCYVVIGRPMDGLQHAFFPVSMNENERRDFIQATVDELHRWQELPNATHE